jgi:hypothetical protein
MCGQPNGNSSYKRFLRIIAGAAIFIVITIFIGAFAAVGPKSPQESEWPSAAQCDAISKVLEKKPLYELLPEQRRIMNRCIEHMYLIRKESERLGY